ncbi:MAG: OmpA family protein [Sulfuricaulis sp.]|nr:OmpA family protein [Sulfuricaulis sp.]
MNNSSTLPWSLMFGLAFLLGALAMDTHAGNYGYLQDYTGAVVQSGTGTCVHTSAWTPASATAECDTDLMPKMAAAVPAEPAPPARAEPVAVAAVTPIPMPVTEKVAMNADALFDFDKSDIKPQGKEALDEVVRRLNLAGAKLGLIVSTGHADSIGSPEYNMDLSLRRAEAVKTYLISKGIDSNYINIAGAGESQPFADNATAEGRAENRRVEIEVSSTRVTQ